jgi:alpha-mannosidase
MISDAPGANRLERKISLYAGSNEVVIDNVLDKKAIREKEGVHFGFPFHPSLNKVTLDAGYGSMQYLADRLPGSNMDYLYSRRWLDVSTADKGLQWMLLQAPFVEPGNIIDERLTISQTHKEWKKEGAPTATWFSYIMNNYWHTNYKADQDGISHYRYALKPHGMFSYSETEKSAASLSQPLLALSVNEDVTFSDGLFDLSNNRIVVTCVTPQEDGSLVIRLYNPEASVEETSFLWKKIQPSQIVYLKSGRNIPVKEQISLAGMGVMEIKIVQ